MARTHKATAQAVVAPQHIAKENPQQAVAAHDDHEELAAIKFHDNSIPRHLTRVDQRQQRFYDIQKSPRLRQASEPSTRRPWCMPRARDCSSPRSTRSTKLVHCSCAPNVGSRAACLCAGSSCRHGRLGKLLQKKTRPSWTARDARFAFAAAIGVHPLPLRALEGRHGRRGCLGEAAGPEDRVGRMRRRAQLCAQLQELSGSALNKVRTRVADLMPHQRLALPSPTYPYADSGSRHQCGTRSAQESPRPVKPR